MAPDPVLDSCTREELKDMVRHFWRQADSRREEEVLLNYRITQLELELAALRRSMQKDLGFT